MSESTDGNSDAVECYRCGDPLRLLEDTHLEVTWKEGPPPDRDDMAFEDWFSSGAYLCPTCQTKFEAFMAGDQ